MKADLGRQRARGDGDAPGTRYRVVATCGVFEPGFRGGGPVRSLAYVLDTLPADIELLLITRDRDLGASAPYPGLSGRTVRRGRALVHYLDPGSPRSWLRMWRSLPRPVDLLYVNSLWSTFSLLPILAVAARLLSVRAVMIAPRGELSPGALAIKARKKRLFLTAWAPLLRRLTVNWQACSDLEAEHIRRVFPWARVMVSANGTDLPAEALPVRDRPPGPLRLVFISRISPKKNLELALDALRQVSAPVEFDVFGPIEDRGYWDRCRRLIAELPAHVRVRHLGELPPDQVAPTFHRYDAFLFPTLGENFGHVIVESMAASCPVVCSDETPWSRMIEDGKGVVVRPLTATRLAEVLQGLATSRPEEWLAARRATGAAYRSWRARPRVRNVLEQARRFC